MSFEQKYIKHSVSLFDNQKYNVRMLVQRRRALLTDRVGSGKTLSVLYAYSFLLEKGCITNLLVLTPLSAYEKQVWKKDISKFTNLTAIALDDLMQLCPDVSKLPTYLSKYNVIYCKHTHVKSCYSYLEYIMRTPGLLAVIDECHAFRNPKSAVTINMRALLMNVRNVWGITGSTISRSLEDLYNIINLVSPWYLGSFTQFRMNYCTTKEKVVGYSAGRRKTVTLITGVKDEAAFQRALAPLVIRGESFLDVKFTYLDYNLDPYEQSIYTKIANGVTLDPDLSPDEWFKKLLNGEEMEQVPKIKSVEQFSSRFIYLQSAADGILNDSGEQVRDDSAKLRVLYQKIQEIVAKGQSVIVYFDYYASLNCFERMLNLHPIRAQVLRSTGEHVLKDGDVTEGKCKLMPHVILCTKASSESVSYYFINNVIFFHIPTVPSTFVQLVGRITRKNTLYPDDLNVYIFRSENIDMYKLLLVSAKVYQMELTQGEEKNFPPDYKQMMSNWDNVDRFKKVCLWQK